MLSYAMAFCRFLNSCALSVVIPACSSKHQASCASSSTHMMMQSHRFRGAALDLLLASHPQLLVHAPLWALHDVAVVLLYAATLSQCLSSWGLSGHVPSCSSKLALPSHDSASFPFCLMRYR